MQMFLPGDVGILHCQQHTSLQNLAASGMVERGNATFQVMNMVKEN
jgi:hypothetical protein